MKDERNLLVTNVIRSLSLLPCSSAYCIWKPEGLGHFFQCLSGTCDPGRNQLLPHRPYAGNNRHELVQWRSFH